MKPKPRTILHMLEGFSLRVMEPMAHIEANLLAAQPFRVMRVTDHGTLKEATIRAGAILYAEKA